MVNVTKFIFIIFSILIFSGSSVFSLENPDTPKNPALYISEVNYSGSVSNSGCKAVETGSNQCSNDKWLEIYNYGESSINLQGYKIQRFDENEKLFSLGSITQRIELKAESYLVITSKNSNLISLLNSSKTEIVKTSVGLMNGISGNTSGKKYIRLAITTADNNLVSKVNLNNSEISSLESSVDKKVTEKFSISFTSNQSEAKIAQRQSQYFLNNFATPGLPFAFKTQPVPEKIPEIVNAPVKNVAPAPIQIVQPEIIQSEIKPVELPIKNNIAQTSSATEPAKPEIQKTIEARTWKIGITQRVENGLNVNTSIAETSIPKLTPIQKDLAYLQEVSGLNSPHSMALLNIVTLLAMTCSRVYKLFKKDPIFSSQQTLA